MIYRWIKIGKIQKKPELYRKYRRGYNHKINISQLGYKKNYMYTYITFREKYSRHIGHTTRKLKLQCFLFIQIRHILRRITLNKTNKYMKTCHTVVVKAGPTSAHMSMPIYVSEGRVYIEHLKAVECRHIELYCTLARLKVYLVWLHNSQWVELMSRKVG